MQKGTSFLIAILQKCLGVYLHIGRNLLVAPTKSLSGRLYIRSFEKRQKSEIGRRGKPSRTYLLQLFF